MQTPLVTVDWLHSHLSDPDLVILDATQAGKKADHEGLQLPGARHFDFKRTFADRENELPNMLPSPEAFATEAQKLGISNTSKIVVYDRLGVYSSPRVWWMFRTMGHDQVVVLDGGLPEWVRCGYEVEPVQRYDSLPGSFATVFNPDLVKGIQDVYQNLSGKKALVVDARSAGRFEGIAPEPRAGLSSGHIPDSKNLPFPDVLRDGKFKPKAELLGLFQTLDLGDQPLIFSCGSGITACILYVASELVLSNEKAVYDGSWTEWAQDEKAPIVGGASE